MTNPSGATKRWRSALIGIAGAAALAVSIVGCTADPANPTDSAAAGDSSGDLYIVVSGPVSDQFFQPMKLGSDDFAKEFGLNYQYSSSKDYSNTIPDYVQLLNQAIAKHPKGLVVWNTNPDSLSPLIKQAVAQGIQVVEISSGLGAWESDGAISFVGEDKVVTGVAAGTSAAATGVKHLLCINNAASNPGLQERCDGAAQGMQSAGGVSEQLILPDADTTDPAKATQTIQGYLASHPDIDGVWSQNSSIGSYVATAVKNLGANLKQSTLGLSKATVQLLQDGTLTSVIDLQQYLQGWDALQILYQSVKYGIHPTGAIIPGANAITKDNLDETLAIMDKYPGVRGAN